MVAPDLHHHYQSPTTMAKNSILRGRGSHFFTDGCLFLGGALMALLLVWSFSAFVYPDPNPNSAALIGSRFSTRGPAECNAKPAGLGPDLKYDPPEETYYDDPGMRYSIEKPVKGWDEKRREWLRLHPSFAAAAREKVVLVTGSQPNPCKNPIGDHLLLRFFKNKVDYCRIHGCDVFYNNVLLQPKMHSYWAKYPVVRGAMLAHPEAEWIWWVDSDALFSDMDFKLPLERYRSHNLVVHGWPHLVYDDKSWTSINAGVFLIRNCQWSMDFMDVWASTGPQSPDYEKWGQVLSSTFKDKIFPESDDQSALIYLLLKHKDLYYDKIYIESQYYFEGYWLEITGNLANITRKYTAVESGGGGEDDGVRVLRRRHAEKVSEHYGERWEAYLREAGNGRGSWRRPFMTHFTGCQPCSGAHNMMYSGESCWNGMVRALNFADNQVLRNYGFIHPDLMDSATVQEVPFDYPLQGEPPE